MATQQNYTYAIGRRKQSTATVRLFANGTGKFSVNLGEDTISLKDYFGGAAYMLENATYALITLGDNFIK